MKLSIIIPVYNVEQYIGPCLESVFRQGLHDDKTEVIVVNDGTKDRSMDIVSKVAGTHGNVIVVEQKNQGLSAARNTGLKHATGDYVLLLDSDDLLIPNTLPTLLQTATDTEADIIVADFVKMDDNAIDSFLKDSASHHTPIIPETTVMSGSEMFTSQLNPRECYVWRTLYKRSFLEKENLSFIPGLYFEDVPFTPECYLKAGKSVRIQLPFYIYRQRTNSIVSSLSMRKLTDLNTTIAHLWQMRDSLCATPEERKQMDNTIFATFQITVWYISTDKKLVDDRHTYVADLHSKVPGLRFSGGLKQRVVSALFRTMPETYIWLRYMAQIR